MAIVKIPEGRKTRESQEDMGDEFPDTARTFRVPVRVGDVGPYKIPVFNGPRDYREVGRVYAGWCEGSFD